MSSPTPHVLRLSQFASATAADTFRVELSLDDGAPVCAPEFPFSLSAQDREDLRWYLEDYLPYPFDPAPAIAARVEKRMHAIGSELFNAVFESCQGARDLWALLRDCLDATRVQVIAETREAVAIPWELMRDPATAQPLVLTAQTFVRAPLHPAPRRAVTPAPAPLTDKPSKVRVLLVICRPRGGQDVAFRSVASRIVKSLSAEAEEFIQLDVLRPPTLAQLAATLEQAKTRGEPYHVVHFDGQGAYLEAPKADTLGAPHAGKHGYLNFESPNTPENVEWVDGPALGNLLVQNDVPVLVLNACQSAFAEAPAAPLLAAQAQEVGERVHAFGSLAQEVMDAGVPGVVALPYVLFVETSKHLVANLYAAFAQGQSLGQAVSLGRKQLAADPWREIAYKHLALQDWSVPIAYEATPLELFPRAVGPGDAKPGDAAAGPGDAKPGDHIGSPLRIISDAEMQRQTPTIGLPPRPDAGFFGRDETFLALDRAFDTQPIVLLHAYAGSGKTATAAEYARWYALTGGNRGPVLFTSFREYNPLSRLLDILGQVFAPLLEQNKIDWLTLSYEQRRSFAPEILKVVPTLWIWDNVEPVNGFPTGTPSAWSEAEQKELYDFLGAARETQAKFLLTSCRDETQWLHDLPYRIPVPPMPEQEQVQLTRALAERRGHQFTDVEDWRPLLRFAQGNPMTITVLVGQALRDGYKTREQIVAFVEKLRAGTAAFADEASQGRAKSLGVSLSYGFENGFTEPERKQLALLHFFHGFVNVAVLWQMGSLKTITGEDYSLPEVRGLTREDGVRLLDRAAAIGLLTVRGDGYYSIHPVLPWYFKGLFDQYYAGDPSSARAASPGSNAAAATRAFVEAMGTLGNYYHDQYGAGNREVLGPLNAEEANLLDAWQRARANGWWSAVVKTMQGLRVLYDHAGSVVEWTQLVNEIVPEFVDLKMDDPLPGREAQWSLVTEYRVRLACQARQWGEAERLQRRLVERWQKDAADALPVAPDALDDAQHNAIRSLAVSWHHLGDIQRELGQSDCVKAYQECARLAHRIGERPVESEAAFYLGTAYKDVPALRDLAQADKWYRRSLELTDEGDWVGRSTTMDRIGLVMHERFTKARDAHASKKKILQYANDALNAYQQSLELTPPDAPEKLGVAHARLADLYAETGHVDLALPHFQEAIRCTEASGDHHLAGQIRFNTALSLSRSGRLEEARDYARAALRDFETFGDRATGAIEETRRLIARIEQDAAKGK